MLVYLATTTTWVDCRRLAWRYYGQGFLARSTTQKVYVVDRDWQAFA